MVDGLGPLRQRDVGERLFRGWKAVAAAWAVVLVAALVLLAGHLLRPSPGPVPAESPSRAGAVIPRHDPLCDRVQSNPSAPTVGCPEESAPRGMDYPDW